MKPTYVNVYYCNSTSVYVRATKKNVSPFGGSAFFTVRNNNIEPLPIKMKDNKTHNIPQTDQAHQPEADKKSLPLVGELGGCVGSLCVKNERSKTYSINAKKVKAKALAMFNLRQSRKFCAFITISFPCTFPDSLAHQALNTWLTRVRKYSGLKMYLWVAERQKNGTIHYHVLINQYLNIRVVNRYMAVIINNIILSNSDLCIDFDTKKYNGVDLKRVDNNVKALASYLTKYVSKSTAVFNQLAFHCSRTISALFVSARLDNPDSLSKIYGQNMKVDKVIHNEHGTLLFINSLSLSAFLKVLYDINEKVIELLQC